MTMLGLGAVNVLMAPMVVGVRTVFVVGGLITLLAGILSAWIFRGYVSKPELEAELALQAA